MPNMLATRPNRPAAPGVPRTMNSRQRILREHTSARDKAETLLRGLLDAKASTDKAMSGGASKAHTGGPRGLECAIASTRRLVEAYTRTLEAMHRELSEEDLVLLDEVEAAQARDARPRTPSPA